MVHNKRQAATHVLTVLVASLAIQCGALPNMPVPPGLCPDMGKPEDIARFDFSGTFGLPAPVAATLKSDLSASATMKTLADKIDADLLAACGGIAKDLDDTSAYPSGHAACQGAIKAIAGAKGKLGPNLSVRLDVSEPQCTLDLGAYGACVAHCAFCKAQCDAQAQANVSCQAPHVSVQIAGASDEQSQAAAKLQSAIEKNLPRVIDVGRGMAKNLAQIAGEVPAVVQGGQAAVKGATKLTPVLVACVAMPFKDGLAASASLAGDVAVSVDVEASVSGGGSSKTGPVTAALPPAAAHAPSGPAGACVIDDMADGDGQILSVDGRSGGWFTYADSTGSEISPPAGGPFTLTPAPNEPGFTARFSGRVSTGAIRFAGAGFSFTNPRGAYDASRYTGVSFWAKTSAGSSPNTRFMVADGNTDPAGHVCTKCFNSFGYDLVLTEQWHQYVIPFAEMSQLPGWGAPRPPRVNQSALYGMQWQAGSPGATYDIWVKNVSFTGCD